MNLRQKQKQFEALKNSGALAPRAVDPALDADFKVTKRFTEAVSESFTQYQYRSTPEAIRGGLELLALGNAHKNAHYRHRKDTHYGMAARKFNEVAKSLGFEQVGRFRMHRKEGRREHTYVMARPDGLVLTWNTYGRGRDKSMNDAKLTYQWKGGSYPEQASGGYLRDPKAPAIFFGSNCVREGLRETVNRLAQSGHVLPVWKKSDSFEAGHLFTLEQDYSHQKDRDPAADKDFGKLGKLVDAVNAKRAATMPLWVRQMTAQAPR
jgi:hypothetical protein